MKMYSKWLLALSVIGLTACSLTPEQQAVRDAKRVRVEQALQVKLAAQCDSEAAELLNQQFNPPLNQNEKEKQLFEARYIEKINQPMFQACYKMAVERYKAQAELEYMRQRYYLDDFPHRGWGRFCYSCW